MTSSVFSMTSDLTLEEEWSPETAPERQNPWARNVHVCMPQLQENGKAVRSHSQAAAQARVIKVTGIPTRACSFQVI